jgi:hypothetical protein
MERDKKKIVGRKLSVTRVSGGKTGRTVWRLSDGRVLKSSPDSTAVIDQAVQIYSAALKRLAKR